MDNTTNQNHGQSMYQQQPYPTSDNTSTFHVLHIVKAVLTFFVSLLFLIYAFMGTIFSNIPHFQNNPEIPFNLSMLVSIIGIVGFIVVVILGVLNLLTARYIKEKRNYTFIFVMSIINCLSGILGILLGVFTIIEINKPHIKAQFDQKKVS